MSLVLSQGTFVSTVIARAMLASVGCALSAKSWRKDEVKAHRDERFFPRRGPSIRPTSGVKAERWRAFGCIGFGLLLAGFSVAARGQAPQQIQYEIGKRSTIAVATPAIGTNPLRPALFFFAFGLPRAYAFGDFDGDGLLDVVVAPSYWDHPPERGVEIWINQGDGTFRNGTSDVLKGATVFTGTVNAILVADFNEDGRPDVVLVDTGLEINQPAFPGHRLGLLLSQPDGSLRDAADQVLPNPPTFNHAGAVADINGDGHLDLLVTRMGIAGVAEADGTLMLLGDGKGGFHASTTGLPEEVAYQPWAGTDFGKDRQTQGCSAAADLDGDGRIDLITGSYGPDHVTRKRTIRFH